MSTPRQILGRAYNKSSKNEPGKSLADTTEGLALVNTKARLFFALGARVNPLFFGVAASVAKDVGGYWPLTAFPSRPEIIFDVKNGSADVAILPYDDLAAEPQLAAVYFLGQRFYPAGRANDATGALTFWYARAYTDATIDAEIDAFWPTEFDELLVLEVAATMALKDGRAEEAALLKQERDTWLRAYLMRLEHLIAAERRSKPLRRRFATQSMAPLGGMLAGGTEVVP